jgi:hypothetical protein
MGRQRPTNQQFDDDPLGEGTAPPTGGDPLLDGIPAQPSGENQSSERPTDRPPIHRQEKKSNPIADFGKELLKIGVFILFASLAAYLVGTSLQRQKMDFELKSEMLKQGKQRATDLYLEIRELYRQIRADEPGLMPSGRETWLIELSVLEKKREDLERIREELEEIKKFSEGVDSKVGFIEAKLAKAELDEFIRCLQGGGLSCSKDFDLRKVEEIRLAYSKAIIDLLKKGK